MDGFPVEFYRTFWNSISSFFFQIVSYINNNQILPDSMNQSLITVIPKPSKKGDAPADYRPISLTNCDNKILAKVISNRLSKIPPNIIHHDQTGFVKNRFLQTNIRNCLSIIQYAKRNNIAMALLAVDAEKAFDQVEWNFLFKTLEVLKMPTEFINLIRTLYKKTHANIYTKGTLSNSFQHTRGTKEGCPLSPLVFTIFIEPLATRTR